MAGLAELFEDQLRDIYYAEKRILKALPKMAKKATAPELIEGFKKHLDQTEGQVDRLEQVFEIIGKAPRGKTCPAIDGILEEGSEIMDEHEPGASLDAAMAAAAQSVEHYEIARYGTLIAWANELGMADASTLLRTTLDEESATDATLTKLATSKLNAAAVANGESGDMASKPKPKAKK